VLSPLERFLSLFTKIRPGEGRGVMLICLNGFLLLTAYYVLKTLREPLILTEFGAETKSYAVAAIAIVLFFIVPLYGVLFRNTNRTQLVVTVNLLFLSNLAIFYFMAESEISIAFGYFVWVGIFGVMVIAQFWAYVTDIYNVKSGQRVFPVVMIATTLGGLAGAQVSALAFDSLGLRGLMILAGALILLSIALYRPARLSAPDDSRCIECEFAAPKHQGLFGGFAVVMSDHYLRLIAVFVVLLNWINSTGEYILSEMVVSWATTQALETSRSVESWIAYFYGNYAFLSNLVGLAIQTLIVAKAIRVFGLPRLLLVLPFVSLLGYLFLAFIPIFTLIRIVKIAENGIDYSLTSTLRQALFLPTSREVKYEGKTAIDTFFWRFGDLNATSRPPVLNIPVADVHLESGRPFEFVIEQDTFVDPDPGDMITLSAELANGGSLPKWMGFRPSSGRFFGSPPRDVENVEVRLIARDFEDMQATTTFALRFT